MVAVWIILGFLAGVIFNTICCLILGAKFTSCSLKEYLTYTGASMCAKSEKNITQQAVSVDIDYMDHTEKLTLE